MTTQPQNNDLRMKAEEILDRKHVENSKEIAAISTKKFPAIHRETAIDAMLELYQEQGQREAEQAQEFFPMSHRPQKSKDDEELSETVLAYSDDLDYADLAYFDFKTDEWAILGDFSFIMKCWMPIPEPKAEAVKNFTEAKHRGYC